MAAAKHRRRDDRPHWHGWALLAAVLAMLAGVVGFFVQVGIQVGIEVYTVIKALRTGVAPTGFNTWAAIWPLAVGMIVAIVLASVVEKADKPAEYSSVLATVEGGQSYFLYLRPFAFEKRLLLDVPFLSGIPYVWLLPPVRLLIGFERNLRDAVRAQTGAVMVAIGETDRNPGIAKYTPTDAEWQALFVRLATKASGIVIVPSVTAGTLWELDWIVAHALAKTVFVLPPVHTDPLVGVVPSHAFASQWALLRGRYGEQVAFPDYQPQGLMFTFEENKTATGTTWMPGHGMKLDSVDVNNTVRHLMTSGGVGGLVEL